MYESPKVLLTSLISFPNDVLELMGRDLSKGEP
jgi:hypothetical protein